MTQSGSVETWVESIDPRSDPVTDALLFGVSNLFHEADKERGVFI
jgi:hypothetical protein